MPPRLVLVGKKNHWKKKLIGKKLFEKKINWKKILLVKFLNFCLKTNVNLFFWIYIFFQIYKLRQPFINQKNYQTSFYDSFLNFCKYNLKNENEMVNKQALDCKNIIKLTNN